MEGTHVLSSKKIGRKFQTDVLHDSLSLLNIFYLGLGSVSYSELELEQVTY